MIKLIFNRFAGESSTQEMTIKVNNEIKVTGAEESTRKINDTKNALEDLSKTGININPSSLDNATKKLNYLQTLITTLKSNSQVDVKAGIGALKDFNVFNTLPKGIQGLMSNIGDIQSAVSNDDSYKNLMTSVIQVSALFGLLSDAVKDTSKEFENNDKSAEDLGKQTGDTNSKFKEFLDTLKDAPNLVDDVSDKFRNMDFTKLVFLWHTVRRVTRGLVDVVENAANYEESLNLYSMALGRFANQASVWSDNITNKLKLDPSDVMKYTGAFYNLVKGMQVGADDAYIMSKNLTQLSYDMASYLNISNEAAQAKIQSAMSGQSRAVASVGVAMQVASLQELAYSMGIKKSVKEMTQAEKTYLRYIQLMNSTKQMQGDLGRTMITPANAIRTLKNQINLLGRAIGQVLTPLIMEAIPYIMAFTNVLTRAASALANFFGYKISDVDYSSAISFEDAAVGADNLGKLGSAASKAGKQVSESLAPFDELNNVISENDKAGSYGGSGGGSIGIDPSVWDKALPQYDMLKDYTDDLVSKAEKLEGKATGIAAILGAIVGGALLGKIATFLVETGTSLKTIYGFVTKIASKFTGPLLTAAGDFAAKIGLTLPTAEALQATFATIGQIVGGIALSFASLSLAEDAVNNAAEDSAFMSTLKADASVAAGAIGGGLIGGVPGAIIGTLTSIIKLTTDANIKSEELMKTYALGIGQFKYDTRETTKLIDEFNYKYGESMSIIYQTAEAKLKDISYYESLRDRLSKITDEHGNVIAGHKNEAKAIVEELNPALGTNMKIRGNQIEGYDKATKKIDKLLEKMKAEVKIEAMREAWKQAILNEAKALDALNDAEANRARAQEIVNKSVEKYGYVTKDAQAEFDKWDQKYKDSALHYQEMTVNKQRFEDAMVEHTKGNYDIVNKIYDESGKHQYSAFCDNLVKMTNQIKPGGELGEDLIAQWKTLGYSDVNVFNNELMKIGDEKTRQKIIDALKQWDTSFTTIGTNSGNIYAGGITGGAQSYFDKHTIRPTIGLGSNVPQSLYNDVNKPFKNNTITAHITAGNSGSVIQSDIKKYFKNNPMSLQWSSEKNDKGNGALCVLRAGGGYVDSGDLFFANENGVPEYVTSIGGKSAVVNQGQMIQTLTNAIVAGFQQFGGNQASNVTVYVGDKKLYQGQGEYQNRQNDRYGTTVVRI